MIVPSSRFDGVLIVTTPNVEAQPQPMSEAIGPSVAEKLADEFVVLGMRADPKPVHSFLHWNAESAVVESDTNAVESRPANSLELQRRMRRIGAQESVVSTRESLDFSGQCIEALPKALRSRGLQGSRREPER
jgi:hypothetical protein